MEKALKPLVVKAWGQFVPGFVPCLKFCPRYLEQGTKCHKAAPGKASPNPLPLTLTGKRGQIKVFCPLFVPVGTNEKNPESLDRKGQGTKRQCLSPVLGILLPYIYFFLMLNNRDKRGQNKEFVPWPLYIRV